MKDLSISVELKCFFCSAILESEEEKEYASGDLIKCVKCGELNDFDELVSLASDEGKEIVLDEVKNEITKLFKNTFK